MTLPGCTYLGFHPLSESAFLETWSLPKLVVKAVVRNGAGGPPKLKAYWEPGLCMGVALTLSFGE